MYDILVCFSTSALAEAFTHSQHLLGRLAVFRDQPSLIFARIYIVQQGYLMKVAVGAQRQIIHHLLNL